ncbi:MAG: 16S rRNA (cytidine(1402)-2'-O)-methyltransferase [Candidatus Bathyarchaeota archaeon]|nr:16S rRNA (cytidine(1402)-2'-O)-methyltransferase [Candidatus Bathyarchaeota archaeon]
MATLYIVATPIGNLSDITSRTLQILKEVDLILCEDTRTTQKLLNFYDIKTPTLSYHQHSKIKKIEYILSLFRENKDLALVSDAGTPGISDPGNKLIELALKKYENLKVVPIPGTSAVTCAASISGFPTDRFLFLGFPPAKRKRKKFFTEVIGSKYPVIFYESPHRIKKTLEELDLAAREQKEDVKIVVCREMTKKFETIYRGKIQAVIQEIEGDKTKGEFVVIVSRQKEQ